MKISIKLFIAFIVILVASLSINSVLVLHRSFESGLQEKESSAAVLNKQTARQVQQLDYQQDKGIKEAQVIKFVGTTQDNVLIWDAKQQLIYHEDMAVKQASRLKLLEGDKQQIQYLLDGNRKYVVATIKVQLLRKTYYISTFTNLNSVYAAQNRLLRDVQVNLLVLFLVSTAIIYVLTKQILVPVHQLRQASRSFQTDPMGYQPLKPMRHDELTELVNDFNQMAHQIQAMVASERENAAFQKEFASHLTHEINTPLTIILGYAELIAESNVTEEVKQEAVRYIVDESTRLKQLGSRISQLIQYDHVTLQREPISSKMLHEKVTDIALGIRQQTAHGFQFDYASQADYRLHTDMGLVSEMLVNLLDNAVKALPQQGGRIVVAENLDETGLTITITVNGHGLDEQAVDDVFEPFVTDSELGEDDHLGLGLSIVKRISTALGWRVALNNNSGEGVTVSIQVPAQDIER